MGKISAVVAAAGRYAIAMSLAELQSTGTAPFRWLRDIAIAPDPADRVRLACALGAFCAIYAAEYLGIEGAHRLLGPARYTADALRTIVTACGDVFLAAFALRFNDDLQIRKTIS